MDDPLVVMSWLILYFYTIFVVVCYIGAIFVISLKQWDDFGKFAIKQRLFL